MLERYLADFLAFFFPQAQAEIDWQHGYTFLDKELQQVARDAALGRLADKLVQVWRHGGQETWVLVHIEVQSQVEAQHVTYISTAERMGHQKGLQEGLQQDLRQGLLDGLELALELKFGHAGLDLVPELRQIEDPAVLRAVGERLRAATTLDELRRVYVTGEAE